MTENTERERAVYQAKLSEQAERYEEMVESMNKVARMGVELTLEERNLLSVAYKNVIGARRASWRILTSIEAKAANEDKSREALLKSYKGKVEEELLKHCSSIMELLDQFLIRNTGESDESKVFYYKMKADYHRYLAEFQSGSARKEAATASLEAYKTASDIAMQNLHTTHPVRLGLALNFSVFYYEILDAPDRACMIAKTAFDSAVADLESLSDECYKDSTLIMQLLRDNLTLWTSDNQAKEDEDADVQDTELQDVESNGGD